MGQNFNVILIKKEGEEAIQALKRTLESSFIPEKEIASPNGFLLEKQRRPLEGLISISYSGNMITIDDEYELIRNDLLRELSELCNTEILKATHSDTAGISMIRIYNHGNLTRLKLLGVENDLEMLSVEELEAVKGVGEVTKYEEDGSNAISVLDHFKRSVLDSARYSSPLNIYKAREKN